MIHQVHMYFWHLNAKKRFVLVGFPGMVSIIQVGIFAFLVKVIAVLGGL